MDYDYWFEKYLPITNHFAEHGFDNTLFETYGEEGTWVANAPNAIVWTLVETDEDPVIVPGYHLINRIGHFVTEVEWEDEALEIAIYDEETV